MGNTRDNRFTVHQRLAASEARLTSLEAENKQLRQWVLSELTSKIKDAENLIQDSIRIPVDGKDGAPGRDGVDGQSIVGPQGPCGDVLIPNETELQQAVIDLRRKLLELRAAAIARIVQGIEDNPSNGTAGQRLLRIHLEKIRADIEKLQ